MTRISNANQGDTMPITIYTDRTPAELAKAIEEILAAITAPQWERHSEDPNAAWHAAYLRSVEKGGIVFSDAKFTDTLNVELVSSVTLSHCPSLDRVVGELGGPGRRVRVVLGVDA